MLQYMQCLLSLVAHLAYISIFLEVLKPLTDEDQIIVTMFVLPENSIKIHDIRAVEADARLLGLSIPYIVTLQKLNIVRDVMSDFSGLEDCDRNTKEAVIDFSYHLSLGNSFG